ncbi:FAD-binding oxidoreductase [Falsiroseomonas sp. HW251]|uniref:FAD-binding oxidoreductase n=1 Tax=Falsiroseomonas sp. HW251 TaxID=3390998 RepID=UPI003D317D9C
MNAISRPPADLPAALVAALSALLGERFSRRSADLEQHGRGESYHPTCPPQAVCRATATEEVARIVTLCAAHRVPVIPFGAGTSLEGHVLAVAGGISLDLSGMNRIVAVRPGDLDATVEAGVTRQQLNAWLRDQGLFFPVDPGAECTLGGMAATRASGTNAVRYGTMRENVIALTAVMADGSVIRTGSRARKSSAGYDLTRLLVGSEGTLGIITEVTLRLYGVPEAVSAAICHFPDVASAVATVTDIVQAGNPVARAEMLDDMTMRAINRYSKTAMAEAPTLFLEFHGSAAGVEEQAALAQEIADGHGGTGFERATGHEALNRLWHARHNVHYAVLGLSPGRKLWSTDVCVPLSQLTELVRWADRERADLPVMTSMVGHVGDGNFHMGLLIHPDDPAELGVAEAFNERLVERAIALEGTCTGEHGVGTGKRKFLVKEHGAALAPMRAIKAALDPLGILNPGKVLPD